MVRVVSKWLVRVIFTDRAFEFYVSDNFLGNVLRHIAVMEFSANSLEQPTSIVIERQ